MIDFVLSDRLISFITNDNIWVSVISWIGALLFGAILAVICALIETRRDKDDK